MTMLLLFLYEISQLFLPQQYCWNIFARVFLLFLIPHLSCWGNELLKNNTWVCVCVCLCTRVCLMHARTRNCVCLLPSFSNALLPLTILSQSQTKLSLLWYKKLFVINIVEKEKNNWIHSINLKFTFSFFRKSLFMKLKITVLTCPNTC